MAFVDRVWPSAGGYYHVNELVQSTARPSGSLTVPLIWRLVKGVLKLRKPSTTSTARPSGSLTVPLIWRLVKGVLKLRKPSTTSSSQTSPAFGLNIIGECVSEKRRWQPN